MGLGQDINRVILVSRPFYGVATYRSKANHVYRVTHEARHCFFRTDGTDDLTAGQLDGNMITGGLDQLILNGQNGDGEPVIDEQYDRLFYTDPVNVKGSSYDPTTDKQPASHPNSGYLGPVHFMSPRGDV